METAAPTDRQSWQFLLLYALAWAGGSIAYVPFLTILLPARVASLAGQEAVSWLAQIAFAGAVAASIANIGFGWLSDLTRNRKVWIFAGAILSSSLLVLAEPMASFMPLLAAIVAWQFALNMMLGPLAAWAGDCVPDRQKGALGGLLAFAPAIGALSGVVATSPVIAAGSVQIWFVASLVILFSIPVLIFGRPRAFPELMESHEQLVVQDVPRIGLKKAAIRMWLARLLVQIAEAALFAYLLLWFRSLDAEISDNTTASVFSFVLVLAIPVAMIAGRLADRYDRPILPLAICAVVSALGLAAMAFASGINSAIIGYVLFGTAAAVFLSLHSAQTLRVLPNSKRRGRDLGLFNLTNTLPSLIMPWLTLMLVPLFGFSALFALLAVLAVIASILLLSLSVSK
jgi:MFS family permease